MRKAKKKNSLLESLLGTLILIALAFWFFSDGESEEKIATKADNRSFAEGNSLENSNQSLPSLDQAKPYRVIVKMDATFPINRVRYVLNVSAPEAETFEERAQTTLKAAIDVQKQTGANIVAARLFDYELENLTGIALAMADYSGDGKDWSGDRVGLRNGNWEVDASDFKITKQQMAVGKVWENNYQNFQIDDGFDGTKTDGMELRNYIAEQLNMTEPEVLTVIHEIISGYATTKSWPEN